ncbi:uncharacterized protein SPPG_08179 [Spizellomyces punctatus DAOM BR117]|uniref:Uncharacterized protein n=1 Tax=Spizellomyces punctatus (strain DAOM BR117) TaxID=645134 RepID=A0A0L0H530_SPIPD|nr:uncharacterized protein SPPG_08179 [Spizellomyces punctatus DAOM BR117]KNC96595.1 hypothetical protein SPPG_08179 [Spizellomyces punctatus DAOM BR117]|eukprot:XP_016604635.1 hypothetical protein SPPG_08179 [Spizellomyces punctatus DAOM BR117]
MDASRNFLQSDRASEHERALSQLQQLDQRSSYDRDSSELFKSLDQLRRMQIDLALEHLAMESVPTEELSLPDLEQDKDSAQRYQRNADRFAKREADVNNLMLRLEDLSQAMRDFHDSMDDVRTRSTNIQREGASPNLPPSEKRPNPTKPVNVSEKSQEPK